jgi:hypothetical protein
VLIGNKEFITTYERPEQLGDDDVMLFLIPSLDTCVSCCLYYDTLVRFAFCRAQHLFQRLMSSGIVSDLLKTVH